MEKAFKNILIIDMDTTRREAPIMMGKTPDFPQPTTEEEWGVQIIDDMATLCEGICTLIHLAEEKGLKSSPDSLRDCIKHLQDGFADASYKGFRFDDWEKRKLKK